MMSIHSNEARAVERGLMCLFADVITGRVSPEDAARHDLGPRLIGYGATLAKGRDAYQDALIDVQRACGRAVPGSVAFSGPFADRIQEIWGADRALDAARLRKDLSLEIVKRIRRAHGPLTTA